MPFIDEQNPQLNVNDEQIALINARLFELHKIKPVNFLSIVEDFLLLFKNINPTHETTDAQEFYDLLTITAENKALENEVIRKCNLIKFIYSVMNDTNIPNPEFNRLCQLIHSHQEIPIVLFLDKIFSTQFHDSIVNNLMDLVSGYLYVKDALPQSLFNIFILKDLKQTNIPQIPRITSLQLLASNIADSLGEELIYDSNKGTSKTQSNLFAHKPKACRALNFDNIDAENSIEMVDLKQTPHYARTENKLSFEKNYPPKIHKAYIQILFFKHIASYPGVMQLQNNKIHRNAQRAIEGICTKISHYVYPQVTSSYENGVRFELNKFIKNESSFWYGINIIRAQRQKLEQEKNDAEKKKYLSGQEQTVQQIRHTEYTEIPDHNPRNPSSDVYPTANQRT